MQTDEPRVYEIRIAGHLPGSWRGWFAGLAIRNEPGGESTLSGPLPDQAALIGLLARLHALNLTLLSVNRL